jgi:hypothetical protein
MSPRRAHRPDADDPLSRTGERVRVAREQLERARQHLDLARKRLRKARDRGRDPAV